MPSGFVYIPHQFYLLTVFKILISVLYHKVTTVFRIYMDTIFFSTWIFKAKQINVLQFFSSLWVD